MKTDVAILGGGPGGAAAAMFLIKQGIRPLIIEAETYPRYHIGESLTGEAAKVLRDLGLEEEMMRRRYPVKKGVKVYGSTGQTTWFIPVTARNENWELTPSISWQVRRSDFDKMMLDEAIRRGATLLQAKANKPLLKEDKAVRGVQVSMPDGEVVDIETELLLDITGQATFLANHGVTGPKYLGSYDKQIAFFSQVVDTARDDGSSRETDPDNTLIFYQQKYHWAWFIPIEDNVVSVGVVSPSAYFLEKKESRKDFLTRELHQLNPIMNHYMPEIKLVEDVHVIPNYSYQVRGFTGKGYICIGDAHRFTDPIFSFGVTVTMREAQIAAPLIKEYLGGKHRDEARPFAEYEKFCERGSDVLEDMIDCFWEFPLGFAKYVHFDYKDQMTDVFAGRIYEHLPKDAMLAFRKSLKREREYKDEDTYSIPIGSRYHPERASIWEPNAPIQSTEDWMGPR
ncbi:MAG: NAD(P)/FAD-dependent oxidoreductase [Candidatus Bathyarchaeia archaeon]